MRFEPLNQTNVCLFFSHCQLGLIHEYNSTTLSQTHPPLPLLSLSLFLSPRHSSNNSCLPCICPPSHHTIDKLSVQGVCREQTHKQEGEEMNVGKKEWEQKWVLHGIMLSVKLGLKFFTQTWIYVIWIFMWNMVCSSIMLWGCFFFTAEIDNHLVRIEDTCRAILEENPFDAAKE